MAKLNYLELPVDDLPTVRTFYEQAFGLSFTAYGPAYAAAENGAVAIGLNGVPGVQTAAPLSLFEVSNLEEALAAVEAAGGAVTQPIFAFPGGRRFHFRDPAGFELGVFINEG